MSTPPLPPEMRIEKHKVEELRKGAHRGPVRGAPPPPPDLHVCAPKLLRTLPRRGQENVVPRPVSLHRD